MNEQELINKLQSSRELSDVINVINDKNATEEVYKKAISIIDYYNYESRKTIFSALINKTKDETTLISIIKKHPDIKNVIDVINNSYATEVVYKKIVEIIDYYLYESRRKIFNEIINKTKSEATLMSIIEKRPEDIIVINVINSNYATEVVYKKIVVIIDYYLYESRKKIFNEIINKTKDETTLISIIGRHLGDKIIKSVINSNYATEKVYQSALNLSKFYNDATANMVIDEVINKSTNEETLMWIINKTHSKDIAIKVINSDYSTNNIYDAVITKYNKDEEILAAVALRRKRVNLKRVSKEQKENIQKLITVENEDSVTERLRMNVEDGMSTMLWGKSGIGKTQRVAKIDPTYTEIRLKPGMLPEEVVGGKEPNGEVGKLYPPQWYVTLVKKCTEEPDRMHILFIDELTNVRDNIKSLVWDIIEARRVNGNEEWVLPDNCAIVAAGNRPEESTAVVTDYNGSVLPEPLHRRFDFHIEIEFDIREWQNWALEVNEKTGNLNIHPIVLSFCIANQDKVMFSSLSNEKITEPIHDPRRWEKLSKAIYMAEKRGGVYNHVSNKRIEECIGSKLAPAFISYYERTPLDINKIRNDEYNVDDFKNIDDKMYALSMLISTKELSDVLIEDFIDKCLGDEYISIYHAIKKRNNKTLEIDNSKSVKM